MVSMGEEMRSGVMGIVMWLAFSMSVQVRYLGGLR